MYFFLFLTVAFVPASLRAQENADSTTAPCVPPGLAQLIAPDGRIVRVNPVREQAGNETRTAETVATVDATPSTPGGRAAREALKIFEREARQGRPAAALQGHTSARIMLGSMYALGRGTPKDVQSAYLWISAAALQGDTRGNATLLSLEPQLTSAQLAEARLRARSLGLSSAPSPDVALLH